jgi:hypothetical protein
VRQQMFDAHRLRVGRRYLEAFQMPVHVVSELEPPAIGELNDGVRGEDLADRSDAPDSALGIDARSIGQVREAIPPLIEHRAIPHEHEDSARDVLLLHLPGNQCVDEARQIARIDRAASHTSGVCARLSRGL